MCPSGRSPRPAASAAKPDFRPAFDVLDADRDGKISREDLLTFYAGYSGPGAGDDDIIASMISVADSNKNGFVEYEEFERVLDGRTGLDPMSCGGGGVMEDAFGMMDRDGDGKVSLEDLRSYMEWAGFAASDDDIRAMIKLGGGDERDGVSYDGLMKILGAVDHVG
ncbi:calcium-binding protein CP1 [Malania oleifera]|uniref:calcium-binding protein CP1 n=1 Tax=Malania oleifera TaxID=397392 RepID=UPI0025AE96A8|nr:calcium-binding protein CP1 [Malania oleifera]